MQNGGGAESEVRGKMETKKGDEIFLSPPQQIRIVDSVYASSGAVAHR